MAWFETWFDTPYYHILYKDRNFEEAENFITLITKYLQLPKYSKIIDLACGKGRHSVFLNELGYKVLGLDLSKKSILHNQKFSNSTLKFEVHDMRNEIYPDISPAKVGAVLNLFTSFGYFENPEDDRKVFQSISNSLEDEGFFVLDYLNAKWVENNILPEYLERKDGIDFHIKKRIIDRDVVKEINFNNLGKEYSFFEKVKLHTQNDIENYAKEFDLESIEIFGDYALNAFDPENSPRCITIFKKNKS